MMTVPQIGRRVALDLGSVRIGVASTDPSGIIPAPVAVVAPTQLSNQLSALLPIRNLYIGLPRHLSGVEGEAAKRVRSIATELKKEFEFRVFLIDERLSTKGAAELIRQNPELSNYGIDAITAFQLLEFALAGEQMKGGEFGEEVQPSS